jgi:hypothetical protein
MTDNPLHHSVQENLQHEWKVNDLCICNYGGAGEGLVYRVIAVQGSPRGPQLIIKPVLGVFADKKGRKKRGLSAGWCTPLSPRDLYDYLDSLTVFIKQEEERRKNESA